MAKTRAQRKAERKPPPAGGAARAPDRDAASGGRRGAPSGTPGLGVSGEVAEAEAVIETGAQDRGLRRERRAARRTPRSSGSPVPGVMPAPVRPERLPEPEPRRHPAPTSAVPRTAPPRRPRPEPRESRRDRRQREKEDRRKARAKELQKGQAEKAEKRRGPDPRLPAFLLGRAQARAVAGPRHAGPGLGRHLHLRGGDGRLSGRASTPPSTGSSSSSSEGAKETRDVSLVRDQHLLGAREQGQAEPRAPGPHDGPGAQRAPGRRPDRADLGDEGRPEGAVARSGPCPAMSW